MGRKDLSNLLSKQVKHGNRNLRHHVYTNRSALGNETSRASSDQSGNEEGHSSSYSTVENARRFRNYVQDAKKSAITVKMPLTLKISLTIAIVIVPLIFLMIFVVLFGNGDTSSGNGLSFGSYYEAQCDEITVDIVDSNFEHVEYQDYSLNEYVAGVVYAEVGGANNIEVYKTFAVAARTFVERNAKDCTIEASARRQAFKPILGTPTSAAEMIYEAVEATEGQYLISNGELLAVQYDAFCFKEKNSDYYILEQKDQKIPTDWALSNVWSKQYLNCQCNTPNPLQQECRSSKGEWMDGGHGRGMSQYGSYYLAKVEGFTYDQILEYYYGDEITIGSNAISGTAVGIGGGGITSVAGLEIKDTTKADKLNEPITDFLNSRGSSLDEMNNYIYESVVDAGVGTREGVVTAAVSMINYLYDNFNVKLPYYWGGKALTIGVPATFGTYKPSATSSGGNVYNKQSLDCSGFVSWAIKNGGYNFGGASTAGFKSFYDNSCNITDSSCIGQPGDLINYRNSTDTAGHVLLILAVDEENGKYFVAHSGGKGVVMEQRDIHAPEGLGTTKVILMDNYYNSPMNINPNY